MSIPDMTVPMGWPYMIRCPECGAEGVNYEFLINRWDGEAYDLACGHRHHLDETKGGCHCYFAVPADKSGGELDILPSEESA